MADVEINLNETWYTSPFSQIRLRSLIWAMLASLVATIALFVSLHVNGALSFDDSAAQMLAFTVWLYGALTGWCIWQSWRHGIGMRSMFRLPPPGFRWIRSNLVVIPVISANMGMMLILVAAVAVIAPDLVTNYFNSASNMLEPMGTQHPVVYTVHLIGALIILAPLVEELFFRGFLMNMWTPRMGAPSAILLSAAVFALAHVVQPGSFFLGLVAGVLYVRTGTLLVPIVLHFLNNLLALIMQSGVTAIGSTEEMPTLAEIQMSSLAMGIPLLLLGLLWLAIFLYRNWPSQRHCQPSTSCGDDSAEEK